MKKEISRRIENLLKKMKEENIDVILSTTFESSSNNPRYLSNFSGSFAYVIIAEDKQVICSDSRYWQQIGDQSPLELVKYTSENASTILHDLLGKYKRIGYECETTTVSAFNDLKKKMEAEEHVFIECDKLIRDIRISKSREEVNLILKAEEIALEALTELLNEIKPGKTEKELAALLEYLMVKKGADKPSFSTIFGSGPNGASPHMFPTMKKIQNGEFIVIDFGAAYQGYCSDITRTIAVGEPTDEMRKVYETVKKAQAEAEKAVSCHLTGQEIDKIARDIITEAGYGDFFGHGLGHGLGIDVHEAPSVSFKNTEKLQSGAVVTIEPGIYIPNQFGVRIEDDVYVTGESHEVLTNYKKELIIL
ncbi:MAG TPA: aminopeptidase P family protein [Thermotogota bacterium]|nr:aminopeptidase P family protein [Thermotogota bacterium]HPJ88534.1 aminopeptidase P family protein [Thermotogota bacterium]HPR96468.1 aminopeptidase P family protein [Thermotogota bacterium]